MSARLIKQAEGGAAFRFMPFSFAPADGSPDTPVAPREPAVTAPQPRAATRPPNGEPGARAEAERIVTEARAEAETLVARARERAAEVEREARERGMSEGRAALAGEVAAAAEPLRQRLAQTLEELSALRAQMAERAERELVRLALEIARKVVRREVSADQEIVLTLARVALGRLHGRAAATVRLNPEDYNYISARSEQLGAGGTIELVADRSVGRGGCLVETEMGDVDVRVEQQFAEIERGFFG